MVVRNGLFPRLRGPLLDVRGPRADELDELVLSVRVAVEGVYALPRHRQAAALAGEQQRDDAELKAAREADGAGDEGDAPYDGSPDEELRAFIGTHGIASQVISITSLLNKSGLTEVQRLLLSTEGVYETALLRLLKDLKFEADDPKGLRLAILSEVDGKPSAFFWSNLLSSYLKQTGLRLGEESGDRVLETLIGRGVPFGAGKTGPAINRIVANDRKEGDLRSYVDDFSEKGEIKQSRFTTSIKAAMVDYLENLGLNTEDSVEFKRNFEEHQYDEYFAQAYHFALFGDGRARAAQITTISPSDSDFDLTTFEQADEQGVVPSHIYAAAALYQMYVLGDQLGIFELPTALILRRARGRLDLSRGNGSYQLQEYKKHLRTAPLLAEDRQLLYKRVFNEGSGEVLSDAVANEEFPYLWDSLMKEVAEYIRRSEENSSDADDKISRAPIDEAVRSLQYNLSFFATDIGDDVKDLKEQYELAVGILQNPDIVSSVVAGARQNMWTVIERLLADDLKKTPKVSAMRRIAVEGYNVLRYVAKFDGSTPDDDFRNFLKSAETWIIAQGSLGPATPEPPEDDNVDAANDGNDDAQDDWES